MNLQAIVTCTSCRSTRTVYFGGGWDLKNLVHECPTTDHPGGVWHFTYSPPRSIY